MTLQGKRAASKISSDIFELARRVPDNIELVVKDKRAVIDLITAALYAKGHVLADDVPGTGKTLTARAIAVSVQGIAKRVQFTPDLVPLDLTGGPIFNRATNSFEDRPGPVRTANILICDEINRTLPKTQSALLEAMGEGQVTTSDGVTHEVIKPFFVIATQNPIDHDGTTPLPEAQMDRFIIRVTFGYPGSDAMVAIVRAQRQSHPIGDLGSVISLDELQMIQHAVGDVFVAPEIEAWSTQIVTRTQLLASDETAKDEYGGIPPLKMGSSPRGALALDRMARAWALLQGRDYVTDKDVLDILLPVLGHRIIPNRRSGIGKKIDSVNQPIELVRFFREHVLQKVPYTGSNGA